MGRGYANVSTARHDKAPQNLLLSKKIVRKLIPLDTTDKNKISLHLKCEQAAWDADVRMKILGLTKC